MRSRRATTLWIALAAALALVGAGCGGGGAPEPGETGAGREVTGPLDLLVWEGYADDALVKGFEEKYGVDVNVTYIGSNDEVFAKIRTKSGQYDVIPATTDVTRQYIDAGLVQPVDLDVITNYDHLFPNFQHLPQAEKDGVVYGVPHTWSADPILYNADVVKDPEPSYRALFDDRYAGKVALYDDLSSLWVGALVLGYDPFALTEDQMREVVDLMCRQKALVRKYWSTGNDLVHLFEAGEVVIATAWNYMYTQLRGDGMNVERLVPEEGNLGWVDTLMIPVNSPDKYTAELWINWAISGMGGAITAQASGYSIANPDVNEFLPPEMVADLHMDDPAFVEKIVLWEPVDRPFYQDAWNEVKAC